MSVIDPAGCVDIRNPWSQPVIRVTALSITISSSSIEIVHQLMRCYFAISVSKSADNVIFRLVQLPCPVASNTYYAMMPLLARLCFNSSF